MPEGGKEEVPGVPAEPVKVNNKFFQKGKKQPWRHKNGKKNGIAGLRDVEAAKELVASGFDIKKIAKKFNLSERTVRRSYNERADEVEAWLEKQDLNGPKVRNLQIHLYLTAKDERVQALMLNRLADFFEGQESKKAEDDLKKTSEQLKEELRDLLKGVVLDAQVVRQEPDPRQIESQNTSPSPEAGVLPR